MDKVLITDGDATFVFSLKASLDKMHQFAVETASSGADAIQVIEDKKISVLVTAAVLPDMDTLELLAYMTKKRPNTPCIIMVDHAKPWFSEKINQQSFLYYLEKPVKIKDLVPAIVVGLNLRDEGKNLSGMTLKSLLPLFEMLKKTCRMEISSTNRGKGYLYFNDGMILDSHYKKLTGEPAAREIIQWDRIYFDLQKLPQGRNRSRIKMPLMEMAGAVWNQNQKEPSDEDIKLTPESIRAVFEKYPDSLHRIKGYQAMAVISEDGDILVSDQKEDGKQNLSEIAKDAARLISCTAHLEYLTVDSGESLVVNKQDDIILILKPEKKTTPRIRMIGMAAAKGNWLYMKMRMMEILEQISVP